MDLRDMTYLVRAADAIEVVQDGVEMICGERTGDGAIDELMYIVEVIMHHSVCIDNEKDPDHKKFWKIMDDRDTAPEKRAKKLLGIK